jgi:hypothetical protein
MESLAELILQRLECREVGRSYRSGRFDFDGHDRTVGLFQPHIHLRAGGRPEVVERYARIGPGNQFAQFAHYEALQKSAGPASHVYRQLDGREQVRGLLDFIKDDEAGEIDSPIDGEFA